MQDSYGDGTADSILTNSDQNEVAESMLVDSDNDSVLDTYAYDTDQDGLLDAVLVDSNEAATWIPRTTTTQTRSAPRPTR